MATPDAAVAGEAVPSSTTAIKHIAMDMEAIFAIARYNLRLSFFFFLSFFLEFKGHAPALALTKTKRLQHSSSLTGFTAQHRAQKTHANHLSYYMSQVDFPLIGLSGLTLYDYINIHVK